MGDQPIGRAGEQFGIGSARSKASVANAVVSTAERCQGETLGSSQYFRASRGRERFGLDAHRQDVERLVRQGAAIEVGEGQGEARQRRVVEVSARAMEAVGLFKDVDGARSRRA